MKLDIYGVDNHCDSIALYKEVIFISDRKMLIVIPFIFLILKLYCFGDCKFTQFNPEATIKKIYS